MSFPRKRHKIIQKCMKMSFPRKRHKIIQKCMKMSFPCKRHKIIQKCMKMSFPRRRESRNSGTQSHLMFCIINDYTAPRNNCLDWRKLRRRATLRFGSRSESGMTMHYGSRNNSSSISPPNSTESTNIRVHPPLRLQ